MGEPVKISILGVGRFAGLNRNILRNILSARLRLIVARLSGSAYKGIFSGICFGSAGGLA